MTRRPKSGHADAVIGMDWLAATRATIKLDDARGDEIECGTREAPAHNLGMRSQAIVTGERGRVGVARAGVSNGTPTTVISRRLALQIAGQRREAARCTDAPWAQTNFCGAVATVNVAINECSGARVDAIVTDDLPRGVDLVVGRDALTQVREMRFGSVPPVIVCRRRRRGWW